jgi:hypothetical protein
LQGKVILTQEEFDAKKMALLKNLVQVFFRFSSVPSLVLFCDFLNAEQYSKATPAVHHGD